MERFKGEPYRLLHSERLSESTFLIYIFVFQGNILKFDSIKKEHRGTYYCVATNVVGTGARRNIDVEVSVRALGD
jgi:hypothetical protein